MLIYVLLFFLSTTIVASCCSYTNNGAEGNGCEAEDGGEVKGNHIAWHLTLEPTKSYS